MAGDFWDDRARRYGRIACGYLDPWSYQYEEHLRWDVFLRLCRPRPNERVLDVGCGTGRWSVRIAELGCDVSAIDISAEMIRIATPDPRVEYRVGAAEEVDYPNGNFDLALSVTVLQHIIEESLLQQALENLHRMLKRSGRLFLLEYSPLRPVPKPAAIGYMTYRTHDEWLRLIGNAGFELQAWAGVRFLRRRAHSLGLRMRRYLEPRTPSSLAPVTEWATGGLTRGLRRLDWALEFAAGRTSLLRDRSDLHAYVFRVGTR